MGIPAYFSYIVKKYPSILKKYTNDQQIDNLYLDSNSIIYDSLKVIEYNGDKDAFEEQLINELLKKLNEYIKSIKPRKTVYIAFDGVAPLAKMDQQRNRRYKSWFINKYNSDLKNKWDSCAITPGTEFMKKMSLQLKYYFKNKRNIILSTSEEPGEGEHKIFEYIRDNKEKHEKENTVIYGLDADLIMLTLNHMDLCKNIYLFRETPEFIKSINSSLDPNYLYVMDIMMFKEQLELDLCEKNDIDITINNGNILNDYIFLFFMLGNDFMPHFPVLNIRTNGIDILTETYKNVLGSKNKFLTCGTNIIWKNYRIFIKELALNEESYMQNEHKIRNKQEKIAKMNNDKSKNNEKQSKFDKEMLLIPSQKRAIEQYVNPFDDYWQQRYYDMVMDMEYNEDNIKKLCFNYLEGLEWTYKYYSVGCYDWMWKYNYHYPPLLEDLYKYIPYFDTVFIKHKSERPITPLMQLCYVLPNNSLSLLPKPLKNVILANMSDQYKEDFEFKWSYCKYFWECHVEFPEFDLKNLFTII
jgi:5'-3' exoribonuclease 1